MTTTGVRIFKNYARLELVVLVVVGKVKVKVKAKVLVVVLVSSCFSCSFCWGFKIIVD